MRKSITSKIIISYVVIIISSLLFAGVIFGFAAKSFMEKQAAKSLNDDAVVIGEVLKNNLNVGTSETEKANTLNKIRQVIKEKLKKSLSAADSSYVFISKDFSKVLYSKNNDEEFNQQALSQFQDKMGTKAERDKLKGTKFKIIINNEEYLAFAKQLAQRGWIVLYTPIGSIQELNRGILLVLLVSLMFTGLIALVFGIFFAKSIAKPIIKLKNRAEKLSKRDFDSRVEINTGDELEELAHTINKMAGELKEYDLAQKKFLQNASHELKTPLMSIQGYAEGIKDGVFEDNQQALDVISEESTRLKSIVDELIFLSKLETMEDYYKYSIVSMNEIIEKSIEKVNSIALKNNIRINTMLYMDVKLRADNDKFTQALINILGNCLRYAHSEIKISSANGGTWYEIKINDDGDGFDTNEIKNVFERFYKGKKGNTGLGLAITKVIIEKHNGFIKAQNGSNGGAEFVIRLPIE